MKIPKSLILIFILSFIHQTISLNQQVIYQFPFQKIIWSYWHQDIKDAPFFVRLCYYNLKAQAEEVGFQYRVLNKNSAKNYIQNYEQDFVQIRKNSVQEGQPFDTDLIRFLLIEQHGGIWVDMTSVFLNGLSELSNIMNPKYHHLITNKFSSQPEALLPYYALNQNRLQYKIKIKNSNQKSQEILYNEFPGYEVYFVGGKKNSQLIKDIRINHSKMTQMPYQKLVNLFISEDIFINNLELTNYLTLDMAISYTLQKKQRQLDKNIQIFGNRKTAFQHYKVWAFHAELGPLFTKREFKITYSDIFELSQQDFIDKGGYFFMQLKFSGLDRRFFQQKFNLLKKVFNQTNQSFQAFLNSNPSKQTCQQLKFIVQNSVMSKIFFNNSFIEQLNIQIISKQQHQAWINYCQNFDPNKDSIFYPIKQQLNKIDQFISISEGRAQLNWIIHSQQDLNLKEKLNMIWSDNSFFVKIFMIIFFGIIAAICLHKLWHRIFIYSSKSNTQTQTSQENNSMQNQSIQIQPQQESKPFLILKSLINCFRYLRISKIAVIYFIILFNLTLYIFMDNLSGRSQPGTVFLCVLFTYVELGYIEKWLASAPTYETKKSSTIQNDNINNDKEQSDNLLSGKRVDSYQQSWLRFSYETFYLFVNFFSVYMVFFQLMYYRVQITHYAIIVGLIWPTLYKMINVQRSQQSSQKNQNELYLSLKRFLNPINTAINNNYHRVFVILVFGLLNLVPNLKYIIFGQQYFFTSLICYSVYTITLILIGLTAFSLINQKRLFDTLRLIFLISIIIYSWTRRLTTSGIIPVIYYVRVFTLLKMYLLVNTLYTQVGVQIQTLSEQIISFKRFTKLLKYFTVPFLIFLLDNTHHYTFLFSLMNPQNIEIFKLVIFWIMMLGIVTLGLNKQNRQNIENIENYNNNIIKPRVLKRKLVNNGDFQQVQPMGSSDFSPRKA